MNTIIHDLLASESALARELGSAEQRLAQHTPGPWTQSPVGTKCAAVVMSDKRMRQVARVSDGGGGYTEAVANARLIAAAPALLAALEAIAAQPVGHTAADAGRDMGAMCRIARAAIAKAKGQ